MPDERRLIILGAAGRDFHNFNVCCRDDPAVRVVAFTAAQIPDIDDRRYPPQLAGPRYPEGIPIHPEAELPRLIRALQVDQCMFAYSDVSYAKVMATSAVVNAAGADFLLAGPDSTMLASTKPVIAVVATRTGAGKSQTCRRIVADLATRGLRVVVVRHPMPYGDLVSQRVQRFATLDDLARQHCTVEEMEEYEPHIERGTVVYAGVDYADILCAAESDPKGCDVIVWDGGNNDFPFYHPDLTITVADPHRAGHELSYYAGEVNLRLADIVVINKIDTAPEGGVQAVRENVARVNPNARIVLAASPLTLDHPERVTGKRVLVVEDGPTLTHGEMRIGAGTLAARRHHAAEIVDPRPYVVGRIAATYDKWPDIGAVLPAMGYGAQQLEDLQATINATDCDTVVIGTPVDLNRVIRIDRPTVRVRYELEEVGKPDLTGVLNDFVRNRKLAKGST
jgi:predicted GTPase